MLRTWADERLAQGDRAQLRSGYARLSGESSYEAMTRRYLAVAGPADPRYDNLLRGLMVTGHPDFHILRSALFTRCEQEDSEDIYAARLAAALEHLSVDELPQRVLVAYGHARRAYRRRTTAPTPGKRRTRPATDSRTVSCI